MQLLELCFLEPVQKALVDLSKRGKQPRHEVLALRAELDHYRPAVSGIHAADHQALGFETIEESRHAGGVSPQPVRHLHGARLSQQARKEQQSRLLRCDPLAGEPAVKRGAQFATEMKHKRRDRLLFTWVNF